MNKVSLGLFFVFTTLLCFGQGDSYGFTGFGKMPVKTPDSLLVKLKSVNSDPYQKSLIGFELMSFHASHGAADSVVFYAKLVEAEVQKSAISKKEKNKLLVKNFFELANAYNESGLFDEALRYHIQGFTLSEAIADETYMARYRVGMANVYAARKEHQKALTLYNEAIKMTKDSSLIYNAYKKAGDVYLDMKDLKNASTNYQRSLAYFKKNASVKEELDVQLHLGIVAELNGKNDEAQNTYRDVTNKALGFQYYDLYISAGLRYGNLLMAKKDFENAKLLLSMVYVNSLQWGDLEVQLKVLNSLKTLHAATGDYQNAYALTTQYIGVLEEVLKLQNKKEVNELEVKYNTLQKEKEILAKSNELRQQRTVKYSLLVGFLVILIPVIALLYVYYQKLQAQSKLNATMSEMNQQKITALLKDKELELLKASMNGQETERKRIAEELHDSIGGNLAAIKLQLSNLQVAESTDYLIKQVDDTYMQVRDLSHDLIPKKFTSSGFTDLIENYLQQFNVDKTKVSFQAYPDDQVNTLDTNLKVELYKIVQELMTNVLKHANATKVEVQLMILDDMIELIFEDNGIGFDKEYVGAHGLGFRNIIERLNTVNGNLSIDSFPEKGTVINIEIPFKQMIHEV